MSIAMQDDLDRYLAASLRMVAVETARPSVSEIATGLGGAGVIELRRPDEGEDPTEWCHLVAGLAPHLLLVAHDDGALDHLAESAGWTRLSRRNLLMRVGGTELQYEWRTIGTQITLVVIGSGAGSIDGLDAEHLRSIGSLAHGLVAAG